MKTTKCCLFKRLAAAFLVAVLTLAPITITPAEAALAAPRNCRFVRWTDTSFTKCLIMWDKVSGADGYQTLWCWTNGSHAVYENHGPSVTGEQAYNMPKNHVSQMRVRAFKRTSSGKRQFSPWSNIAFITPSPTSFSGKLVSANASNLKYGLKWNMIYGSSGYNLFLSTNPYGTWYWNQSTNRKAESTSVTVKIFKRKPLKLYTYYYFRVVTRRTLNGVFCTVPMPSSSFYNGYFRFYRY